MLLLRVQGLAEHAPVLREVGVETLSDVRFLDEVRVGEGREGGGGKGRFWIWGLIGFCAANQGSEWPR